MDDDVEQMSREQLVDEVRRLRSGIREHGGGIQPSPLSLVHVENGSWSL